MKVCPFRLVGVEELPSALTCSSNSFAEFLSGSPKKEPRPVMANTAPIL